MRLFALLLPVVVPAVLSAQFAGVEPGARVRVTAPTMLAGQVEGMLLELTSDSLVFATRSEITYRMPLAAVTTFTVKQRTRSAGAKKFGFWFGVASLPFGLVAAAVAGGGCDFSNPETVRLGNQDSLRYCPRRQVKGANVAAAVGVVTAVGALEGALLGAIIGGTSWEPVRLPIRVSSSPRGFRIGSSISF